jgi:hypothetical protein
MNEQAHTATAPRTPPSAHPVVDRVLAMIGFAPVADPLPALSGWRRRRTPRG